MKKLFVFLGVLAFSAGMVFAQHDSDVDQHGNDNDVTVRQAGVWDDNYTKIYQNGKANEAMVEQTFYHGNGGSDVLLDQRGNENKVSVIQEHGQYHWASIKQDGKRNNVDLKQNNTNTWALIKQMGNDNNVTVDMQFNTEFGGQTKIDLLQNGKRNNADVVQEAHSVVNQELTNELWARQYGNDNDIFVEQYRKEGGEDNYAELYQNGKDNRILLKQDVAPSYAKITQKGNSNRVAGTNSDFDWLWDESAYQDASEITVLQDGKENKVGLYQENTWTASKISQYGNQNNAMLYQTGDDSGTADIYQNGKRNTANVWQKTTLP